MRKELLAEVRQRVSRQFPEMSAVQPTVKQQADGYQVTFRGKASLPGGRSMNRIVHVHVDADGRITRISTSK
ncbi:MAG: hypothetical protein A2Y93_07300 [Chloroflexi bacterium RBG_13_68_17]|jgi:hypothetical protein|nr:MAG: hypothetical protein A2Y93_07300 [Chloroflexi bacterium RBG_13_68_17]